MPLLPPTQRRVGTALGSQIQVGTVPGTVETGRDGQAWARPRAAPGPAREICSLQSTGAAWGAVGARGQNKEGFLEEASPELSIKE